MANGAVGAAFTALGRRIGTGGPALLGAIEKRQRAARESEQLSQILRSFEEAPVSAIETAAGVAPEVPEIPEENPQIAALKNEITKLDEDDAKINNKITKANQVLTGKVSENTRKIINERRKEFQRQLKNNASSKLRLTTQLGVEAQREATRSAAATRLSESQEQTRRKTAERTNLNDFTTRAINLPLVEARQLFTQIGSKPDGFGDKTTVANQFLRMLESRDKELKAASEDEIRRLERFIDNTRRSLTKTANFRKLRTSKGFRKQLRDFTAKFGAFGESIADIVDPKTELDPESIENLRVSLNNATQLLTKLRAGEFGFEAPDSTGAVAPQIPTPTAPIPKALPKAVPTGGRRGAQQRRGLERRIRRRAKQLRIQVNPQTRQPFTQQEINAILKQEFPEAAQ